MTNDSAAKLAGVGLGNMFLGMFCRQILNGMNSALETMASHAYGKGDVRLAGVHLNRSRVIMTAVYLPLVLLLLNAHAVFIAVGMDEEVSSYAYTYMLPMIPALYLLGHFDL